MSYDEKDIDDVRGTRIVLSIDKRVSNLLSRALKFDTKAYRQLSRPLKSQHYQHSLWIVLEHSWVCCKIESNGLIPIENVEYCRFSVILWTINLF